jgi:hypothetical protein
VWAFSRNLLIIENRIANFWHEGPIRDTFSAALTQENGLARPMLNGYRT